MLSQYWLVFLLGYSYSIQFLTSNYFCWLLFHITSTPHQLFKSSSPELYANCSLLLTFVISFLYLTQSVGIPLEPYHSLCSTCVFYGMLCHASSHQILPNTFLLETEHTQRYQVSQVCASTHMLSLLATKRVLVGRFYLCAKPCHKILYQVYTCLKPKLGFSLHIQFSNLLGFMIVGSLQCIQTLINDFWIIKNISSMTIHVFMVLRGHDLF